MKHPIPWLLAGTVSFLLLLVSGIVAAILAPAIFTLSLVLPIICLVLMVAGLLRAAWHQEQGGVPSLMDMVTGFRTHTAHLALLGLFFGLPLVLLALLSLLALGGGLLTGVMGAALGSAMQTIVSGLATFVIYLITTTLVFVVCWSLLLLCLFFAPALVIFHDAAPLDAMQVSFMASLRNLPAILSFALLLALLFSLAMIPAGLGILVLIPVFAGALYQAYRDIFPPSALPAPEES